MRHLLLSLVATLASIAAAQETGYNTSWSGHRTLGVNTTASGANVSTAVTNFPVLVRLSAADSNVFKNSKLTGIDIRFTKANNTTRLAHEIESWDSAGRSAAIWVKLDTVAASAITQFRMHWGNAAAADSSIGSSVFSASNGYLAVWHMNSPIAARLDTLRDVTGQGHHGIADTTTGGTAFLPADTAGVIGAAKRFRGTAGTAAINTGGYFSVLNADSALNLNTNKGPYTISAWANTAVCHGTARVTILSKYANVNSGPTQGRAYALQTSNNGTWRVTNNPLDFYVDSTVSRVAEYVADGPCAANAWTYLAGTYNTNGANPTMDATGAANLKLFQDSVFSATAPATANQQPVSVGKAANVYIGRLHNVDRFMRGAVDELRIANVARSADWLKLERANQMIGSNVVATVVPPAAITSLSYNDSSKAVDTLTAFQTGVAVNRLPTYFGGPVDSFKVVTGTLPAGVSVVKATGALTGTPTAVTAAANVTIRAWGHAVAGDSVSRTIRVSVVLGPLGNLTYSPDTVTYVLGLPVTDAPSYTGRAPTKFALTSGTLPAGLVLDSVTGVISGTPSTATAAANYVVRATNTAGPDTATRNLRITVAAENFSTGWAQHRDWWLNTQSNGASVGKPVYNFPVLVRLDSVNFGTNFAQTSNGGADLRFSKANNTTRLPHQIDTWDSAGKKASIWVLVDTVPANGIKALRMHWSNTSAPNTSSGTAVFSTANGFRAVWHMNGATAASNEPDATANGMTATQTGEPPAAAGIIGGARNFANTGTTVSDYMRVLGSATTLNFPLNGNYSISAWANLSNTQTHATLLSKHDLAYALKLNSGSTWEFFEYTGSNWNAVSGPAGETGVWYHLIGVQNGADAAFYANGQRVDFGIAPVAGTSARNEAVDVVIGAEPTSNTAQRRPWGGLADEIRIAAVSRDTAWARLEYENQRPTGQTLVAFTQPVSIGSAATARTGAFGLVSKPLGNGVLFQVKGAGEAAKAQFTLVDMWGRTVWDRTLTTSAGVSEVFWNGQANNGKTVSSGVYIVKVALLNASGKPVQTLERKIPLTR
jgi:hypothetical protein